MAGETDPDGRKARRAAPSWLPRTEFARLLGAPGSGTAPSADADIPLARCALLVAAEEYPQLSVQHYLGRLDALAEEVQDRLADESAPLVVLQELLRTLYGRKGFKGNREDYYDPRNSYLNQVLDRATGIPLTLGMVLLEVGWRLSLPLEGVNFPGHFLVRFRGEVNALLLDPFQAGEIHFEDQAQNLLDRSYGGMVRVQQGHLRGASRRDMLARLLMNLKAIHLNRGEDARALATVERLLLVHPDGVGEHRDRGRLLARMGRREEALRALGEYLNRAPEADDVEKIRAMMAELHGGGYDSR